MNRPSVSAKSHRGARVIDERQVEALTVAMIVAPGVYARNRMFEFFTTSGVRRARSRARLVRALIPHLPEASELSITAVRSSKAYVLRYAIPAIHFSRIVELSSVELAALRLVAERAKIHALPASPTDREIVLTALTALMDDGAPVDVSRLAAGIFVPE